MSNHKGVQKYSKVVEDEIHRKLDYDPITGNLRWKKIEVLRNGDNMYNTKFAGKIAGTIKTSKNVEGYNYIHIAGKILRAHRIAWFLYYGQWPTGEINHINHIRGDNRIMNLEVVTREQQTKNASMRRDNNTGITGVSLRKWKNVRWIAQINVDKKGVWLGSYTTLFEAACARRSAEIKYGFSKTHGRNLNIYGEEVSDD